MGIETALIAGGLIGGGSALSARSQRKAAKSATEAQTAAVASEMALQKQMYDQSRQDMMPWMQAGQGGLSALMKLAGFAPTTTRQQTGTNTIAGPITPFDGSGSLFANAARRAREQGVTIEQPVYEDVTTWSQTGNPVTALQMDPGYQFRLDEGMNSLENSAAARGGLLSGNFLKNSQRFGQDYASNEYQNAFNRLAALSGVGQAQAGSIADLGSNYANQAGQGMQRIDDARASGYAARANANTGLINNLTGLGSMAMMGMAGGFGGGSGGGFGGFGMGN
jgi:hypothetical protein